MPRTMPEILVTGGAGFIGSELVAQLAAVMPRGGTVFHLACLGVRHSLRAPRENHEVNATGTLAVLDAARAAGVARFVHVSSSEIYGPARTAPMAEEHPAFSPHGLWRVETRGRELRALGLPPPSVRHAASRPGDVGRLIADSSLAARVLGCVPRVEFEEGLRQLADGYRGRSAAPGTLLESEVERNWEAATA